MKPSRPDEWTHYRYYTEQDIVRLNTVRALQVMGLPLQEIRKVLEYDDLEKIIDFLEQAEKKADEKIAALQYSKSKIQLAKADYEGKLQKRQTFDDVFLKDCPERVILLSDTLEAPALDNLWGYLGHFYDRVPSDLKEQFSFEDLAGIYTAGRTVQALRPLHALRGGGRPEGAAEGEIPLRELHRGEPGADAGRADAHRPDGIWRRAGVYGADHRRVRHSALEL